MITKAKQSKATVSKAPKQPKKKLCPFRFRCDRGYITASFLLVFFAVLHSMVAEQTKQFTPKLETLPDVPSLTSASIMSLGDEQLYFRYLSLVLQNAGDTFGASTPLQEYDYRQLYHWFKLLDKLDLRSNYVPSVASFYYSHTQRREDNRHIIRYLEEHYDQMPEEKWYWLGQAVHLANFTIKDKPLALHLANKLAQKSFT